MLRGLSILLLLLSACGAPDRPSVLLVTVDTLRADALGCAGNTAARTPHADGLAARGTRFADAQTVCPLTLPSHATVLTGLLPPEHGLRDNDPDHPIPDRTDRNYRTVAESLRDVGYSTGAFVSASVVAARTGLSHGFSDYDGPEESVAGELRFAERVGLDTASRAAAWLASAPRPFFAWVHLFDPHDPYEAPAAFRRGAAPGSPAAYSEEVSAADAALGLLLAAVRESGLEASTLVILTSDHGEGLGDHGEPTHGYLLFDTTLRVPLVVAWPDHVPAGVVRPETVSIARVADTVLAAAGVPRPGTRSLLLPSTPETVCAETLYGFRRMGWAQQFSARDGARKVVRGATVRAYDVLADAAEVRPLPDAPPGLLAAIDRHRALAPAASSAGDPLPELAGFPYTSGVGRGRTALLPWDENARRREPDPAFAAALDAAAAAVGRGDPAAGELLAALGRTDPANPSVAFYLGRHFRGARRQAEAAEAFARAFRLGLADARVLDLWLQALLLAGDLEGAEQAAREALARTAPDSGTLLLLAALRARQGRADEVPALLDRAASMARTPHERDEVSRFRHNLASENDK